MSIPDIYHSSPDYPELTGREVRREELLRRIVALWNAGHQIVGIYGIAGIGKSVFTLQAAHALNDARSKGAPLRVLWFELDICPDVGGLLSQLADCVDKIGFLPQARRLRTATDLRTTPFAAELRAILGPNCLIIIDQCEAVLDDSGQIAHAALVEILADLISLTGWPTLFSVRRSNPPPDNFIVTRALSLPIQWVALEELNRNERLTLIAELLPARSIRWEELGADLQQRIVREVAGHPYMLQLFLSNSGVSPAASLAELERHRANNESALDYYLSQVPLASRPLLELLAIITDREQWPFLEGAWQTLGGILGWPARNARAALEDLTQRSLIEISTAGYRLLPFVRQYLRERPPPLGISDGMARLFHFHLARLYDVLAHQVKEQAAARAASDTPQDTQELIHYYAVLRDRAMRQSLRNASLRWVRSSLENLVEPTPWPWSASLSAARCLTYVKQLATLAELESRTPENPLEIGACWQTIGQVCETICATDQALDAYHNALMCWERTQQRHRIGDTWMQMGAVFLQEKRWDEALGAYHNALDWWERTRQYLRMGSAWHQIGMIYAAQKDWRAALDAYRTALDWQGRTHRKNESRRTWWHIAEAHTACGQRDRAVDAYTQAGEILPD